MADAKVGIEIEASGDAGGAIEKIGVGVKTTRKALNDMGAAGGKAFDALGKATVIFNQGLELGKKAFELLKVAIGDTVAKALEFRRANDPAKKFFETAKKGAEVIRARLGDILIPVIIGVSKAFGDVSGSMEEWLTVNRKLFATKIIENLSTVAEVLVTGIAKGTLFVTKVWLGWKLVIEGVSLVVNKFFEFMLLGIDKATGGLARVVGIFDRDLKNSLLEAQKGIAGFGDEFAKSGEDAADAMQKTAAQITAAEDAIVSFETAAVAGINRVRSTAADQIEASIAGTRRNDEERQAAIDREAERQAFILSLEERTQAGITQIREANLSRRIEVSNKFIAETEAAEAEAAARTVALVSSVTGTVVGAWQTAAESIISGQQTASQAIIGATIDTALAAINAAAAAAAAKQLEAHSFLPFVGIAIGAAAAAVVSGIIKAKLSEVPAGMAAGGLVTGGQRGRDSVPAMLTPGEVVIPAPVVRQFSGRSAASRSGVVTAQRGGVVPGVAAAGAGPQVSVNFQSFFPPKSAETKRAVRELGKELTKLQRRRMFRVAVPDGT